MRTELLGCEKMRKNVLFNIIMIILAVVIVIGAVMTVSEYGKSFKKEKEANVIVNKVEGTVSLVRAGTGYSLKENVGIEDGDNIVTGTRGYGELLLDGKNVINIRKNSEVSIKSSSPNQSVFEPVYGTIFADVHLTEEETFCLSVKNARFYAEGDCFYSVEAFLGTQTVNVYSGMLRISFMDQEQRIQQGECAVLTQDEEGTNDIEYIEIRKDYLSNDMIEYLLENEMDYFTDAELSEVMIARERQMQAEKEAQEAEEARILAQGGTVPVYERVITDKKEEETFEEEVLTCTIQINCSTILDNMDILDPGKEKYVPENGIIMSTSKVEFVKGETVFDVLKRACEQARIPVEYEWTVEYGGYYVQGINNLYEFDCGRKSGWLYKVNGWYPNYGSSNYEVEKDDVIIWNYTCKLGNDVE